MRYPAISASSVSGKETTQKESKKESKKEKGDSHAQHHDYNVPGSDPGHTRVSSRYHTNTTRVVTGYNQGTRLSRSSRSTLATRSLDQHSQQSRPREIPHTPLRILCPECRTRYVRTALWIRLPKSPCASSGYQQRTLHPSHFSLQCLVGR